eukprot:PRCOL_00003353-RA
MVDADEYARMYHERYGNEWPFDSPYNYWDPRDIARREAEVFAIDKKKDRLDKWMMFVQELMTPNFTHHGVQVEELPTQVKTRLYDFLHDNMDNIKLEPAKKNKKMCYPTESGEEVHPGFVQLPKALKDDVAAALKPIHERWCNCKLKYSAFYGIRLYYNGCALRCHVDRIETHVVSSVIHIADDVQESWPIEIKDNYGRFHSANLAAGEMLHYESAKLLHCRSTVLRGSWYANAFIHFAPVESWPWKITDRRIAVPPFWQYGLPDVSDDLAAFAMMNGTTPGSPEREQMIVDTVRRQRDRRGWSRNPLLDPTREADEEAARLREAADAIRHHQGGRGTTLDVPRHAAIESNARIRAGGDDSSSPPPPQWRRWTVWALIATGPAWLADTVAST